MGQPIFINTPNGNIVSGGSGGNPVLDLVHATVTWNGVVESFASAYQAQIYYNQVLQSMLAVNATTPSAFLQDLTGNPVIFTISPKTFSVANDGTFIQVIGTGFTPALNGTYLYCDDDDGSNENNGYHMVLTYVNNNLMTAVYYSSGDGALPAGGVYVNIAITENTPPVSNVIIGTTTGNKEVTVL